MGQTRKSNPQGVFPAGMERPQRSDRTGNNRPANLVKLAEERSSKPFLSQQNTCHREVNNDTSTNARGINVDRNLPDCEPPGCGGQSMAKRNQCVHHTPRVASRTWLSVHSCLVRRSEAAPAGRKARHCR